MTHKTPHVPTSPIPTYPQNIPALLTMLIAREAARLGGPVVAQYMVNDVTGEAHLAYATAQAHLRAAQTWVEMQSATHSRLLDMVANYSPQPNTATEDELITLIEKNATELSVRMSKAEAEVAQAKAEFLLTSNTLTATANSLADALRGG